MTQAGAAGPSRTWRTMRGYMLVDPDGAEAPTPQAVWEAGSATRSSTRCQRSTQMGVRVSVAFDPTGAARAWVWQDSNKVLVRTVGEIGKVLRVRGGNAAIFLSTAWIGTGKIPLICTDPFLIIRATKTERAGKGLARFLS